MAVTSENFTESGVTYAPEKDVEPSESEALREGNGHGGAFTPGHSPDEDDDTYPLPKRYKKCRFEVNLPDSPPLKGYVEAEVYENGKPSNYIVRADKDWSVKVHWWLKGALRDCICGYWCLELFLESYGPGPEFRLPYPGGLIPLEPCGDGHYRHEIKVPAGKIDPRYCSAPYKLIAGVTYFTPCKKRGPIAGFCELPTIGFYESDKAHT